MEKYSGIIQRTKVGGETESKRRKKDKKSKREKRKMEGKIRKRKNTNKGEKIF